MHVLTDMNSTQQAQVKPYFKSRVWHRSQSPGWRSCPRGREEESTVVFPPPSPYSSEIRLPFVAQAGLKLPSSCLSCPSADGKRCATVPGFSFNPSTRRQVVLWPARAIVRPCLKQNKKRLRWLMMVDRAQWQTERLPSIGGSQAQFPVLTNNIMVK